MFWNKNRKNKESIILCNSWPKSGTHLLLNMSEIILGGKGDWYKDGAIKSPPNDINLLFERINERINSHGNNFAMKGHIGYSEEILNFIKTNNIKVLFIIRDPRDVVCSTIRWVTDLRKNWDANEYFSGLEKEDQLSYAIKGMPSISPFSDNDSFVLWEQSIVERYKLITPWANNENACFLKYEELSGNLGEKLFNESIERVIKFLSIEDVAVVKKLKNNLIDKKSPTFHSGKSGEWRNEFSKKNIEEFIEIGGENLVKKFNYEPTL